MLIHIDPILAKFDYNSIMLMFYLIYDRCKREGVIIYSDDDMACNNGKYIGSISKLFNVPEASADPTHFSLRVLAQDSIMRIIEPDQIFSKYSYVKNLTVYNISEIFDFETDNEDVFPYIYYIYLYLYRYSIDETNREKNYETLTKNIYKSIDERDNIPIEILDKLLCVLTDSKIIIGQPKTMYMFINDNSNMFNNYITANDKEKFKETVREINSKSITTKYIKNDFINSNKEVFSQFGIFPENNHLCEMVDIGNIIINIKDKKFVIKDSVPYTFDGKNVILMNKTNLKYKKIYPFLNFFPLTCPFIVTLDSGIYSVSIITPKNDVYTFKISYSMFFPDIKEFNIDDYRKVEECYGKRLIGDIRESFENFNIDNLVEYINLEDEPKENIKTRLNYLIDNINKRITGGTDITLKLRVGKTVPEYKIRSVKPADSINVFTCSVDLDSEYNSNHNSINGLIINNIGLLLTLFIVSIINNYIKLINDNNDNYHIIDDCLTKLNNIYVFIDEGYKKYNYLDIVFLLQNKYVFNTDQIDKYIEIYKTKDNKLFQFMMGKGKTSVITPLLCFRKIEDYLKTKSKEFPYIITASHLVKDAKQFLLINSLISDTNIMVHSDYDAKEHYIKCNEDSKPLNNYYNIIDEFDSHHNYLQSNFNYVEESKSHITKDEFTRIFLEVKRIMEETGNKYPDTEDLLLKSIHKWHKQSVYMTFNVDYGPSKLVNWFPLLLPYSKKDTPLEKSNFSSIILTIVLTAKYYINLYNSFWNKYRLSDLDYKFIYKNKNILINLEYEPEIANTLYTLAVDENFEKFKTEVQNNTKENNIINYLYYSCQNKLKITTLQKNVTFQDIIFNKFNQHQVGYTGTIYLQLNDYTHCDIQEHLFKNKVEDIDELFGIELALLQYGLEIKRPPILFSTAIDGPLKDKPLDSFNYSTRGIIDLAGAYNIQSNKTVANYFSNIYGKDNIFYFNDNNNCVNLNGEILSQDNYENAFYYYDQGHIVGTDVIQPQTGHFTIIIDKTTRLSLFAQAIFRFRKLNNGTTMSILINEYFIILAIDDKYDYIFEHYKIDKPKYRLDLTNIYNIFVLLYYNEDQYNKNQVNGLKFQLLKTITRSKSNNYSESELTQDFRENINIEKYLLANIKDLDINHALYRELLDSGYFNSMFANSDIDLQTQKESETQKSTETSKMINQTLEKSIMRNFNKFMAFGNAFVLLVDNIYISKNLYLHINGFSPNLKQDICFIIHNDFIYLELLNIAVLYYNKLDIYNNNFVNIKTKAINTKTINKVLIRLLDLNHISAGTVLNTDIELFVRHSTKKGLFILFSYITITLGSIIYKTYYKNNIGSDVIKLEYNKVFKPYGDIVVEWGGKSLTLESEFNKAFDNFTKVVINIDELYKESFSLLIKKFNIENTWEYKPINIKTYSKNILKILNNSGIYTESIIEAYINIFNQSEIDIDKFNSRAEILKKYIKYISF